MHNIKVEKVITIALKAGKEIIKVYNSDFQVGQKQDNSPITLADKKSHDMICNELKKLTPGIPVISEEGEDTAYEKRKNWEYFWLIDPLDGTKEFIKRNGEFTVNIALIKGGAPIMGVIYVPVKKVLYYASKGEGAYKSDCHPDTERSEVEGSQIIKRASKLPIENNNKNRPFTIIGSRSHMSKETEEYIEEQRKKHGEVNIISSGSSLKLCLIAEGTADIYPRFAPTMEWDTAAGHIIAQTAGAAITSIETNQPLKYNKESLLNPGFVVGVELKKDKG